MKPKSASDFDSVCTVEDVARLEQVADMLRDSKYKLSKQSSAEKVEPIERLLKRFRKVLKLTLAVDLPRSSIERICARARAKIDPDLVLDIAVEPTLIAGAQISWEGKYIDLSANSKLKTFDF